MAIQTTAVQTRVRSEISVKTWTKSTLYVVNEVFRVLFIILAQRGQSNKTINATRDVLHNGLFTWLATHHLESASVEMYQTGSQEATERWDLLFKYANPNANVSTAAEVESEWKIIVDEFSDFMRHMAALPEGTEYRVVVTLKPEVDGQPAAAVEGWAPTTLRTVAHLRTRQFGEEDGKGKVIIDAAGLIKVGLTVRY